LHRPLARLLLIHVHVEFERLGDLPANRQHRVERGHRILKNHGDAVAADVAQLIFTQFQQVLTVEQDFAVDNLAGRLRDQPDQRHHADALAGAGFSHDRHGLTLVDTVRDSIDGMNHAILREELRAEVLHFQQFRHVLPLLLDSCLRSFKLLGSQYYCAG
jgi:hypothetical protein